MTHIAARYCPMFTRAAIDRAWPGWVRKVDTPSPGVAVLRIRWWRWLTWWRVRRFQQWLEAVTPAGVWVRVRP